MNRRRIRQILLVSLLALYGALAVGGSALHSLPGAGHARAGTAARGDEPDRPTSLHDDCPVCHFLAQGQIAASPTHVPCPEVVGIQPVDDLPLFFPAPVDRPSAARAPPTA